MMRIPNQRVQGMRSTKAKVKPVSAMTYEELQQALQRNLDVLSNSALFASSSSQPFRADPLATRLMQMNDKIRIRIKEIEDSAIGNMADELQATQITDESKGMPTNGPRRLPATPQGVGATNIPYGQPKSGDAEPENTPNGHDVSTSFNSGKRRAEEMLHQRHGKVEANGKAKVFHVSAEESLSLQKSPTKQPLENTHYFAASSETQPNDSNSEVADDPMNGKVKGSNVVMSYGRKEPFDELSTITQAAKMKTFISYVPWDSDGDSDSDDELENAILYGDLDAIARAREKAEVLEEAESASEAGSMADGMEMSGIIAVDLDKIREKEVSVPTPT